MTNLIAHVRNVKTIWNLPVVVAINHFITDSEAEIEALKAAMAAEGVPCAFSDGWSKGGQGAKELAQAVADLVENAGKPELTFTYPDCLLYTSDAADDLLCVDLCGRCIIKKKTN